ncbi:hypothetical protein [Kribbella sp. NPDC051770]|uniref:hypothetical protein n=1 Tax=Kribbella sp. NPDC051770 TaxID=3155413 RepID=UPI00343690DD
MRIRRTVIAAGLAVAAVAAFTTSASAAGPAAPSGVKIAWADASQEHIRITWTDAGEANKLQFKSAILGTDDVATVAAGAPNELLVPTDSLYGGSRATFTVASVDSAGTAGPAASSVEFDTSTTEAVPITYAAPRPDGSLLISWHDATPQYDYNPGDPFDGPGPVHYSTLDPNGGTAIPVPGNLRFSVIKSRPRPYYVDVIAENVWGRSDTGRTFTFDQTVIKGGAIPNSAAYGKMLTVSGTTGNGQQHIALQARDSASRPWVTLTSTYSGFDGVFRLQAPSPGARQYRLYAPAWKRQDRVALEYATGVTTSLTRHSIGTAKFSANVVGLGQSVTASLSIAPATGVRTTLQRWNGKAWVGVKDIILSQGRGSYTFKTAARGTTAYRFFVPSTTYGGRAITWTTSASLPLVVR